MREVILRNITERIHVEGPLGSLYPGVALRSDAQGSLKAAFLLCPAEMFVPSSKYCQKTTQRTVSCFTELRSARNSAGGTERICQVDLLENLR